MDRYVIMARTAARCAFLRHAAGASSWRDRLFGRLAQLAFDLRLLAHAVKRRLVKLALRLLSYLGYAMPSARAIMGALPSRGKIEAL